MLQDSEFEDGYTLPANGHGSEKNPKYHLSYDTRSQSGTEDTDTDTDSESVTYIDFETNTQSIYHEHQPNHSLSFIPQINQQFTIYRPLAHGCNGQVSLGNYNGELVAIKQALTPQTSYSLTKEVRAIQTLHKHSDQYDRYVGALLAVDVLFCPTVTVYRFYAKGNLENHLKKHPELDFSQRLSMMYDLSSALKFIHTANILHKDLKAENILIDDDGSLKISDFGCATDVNSTALDFGGDFFTRSPKMLSNTYTLYARKNASLSNPAKDLDNFSKADDIYSLSLVLYHIITGELPYSQFRKTANLVPLYNHVVLEKQRPDTTKIPKDYTKVVILLSNCWQENENSRPNTNSLTKSLKQLPLQGSCHEKTEGEFLRSIGFNSLA